MKSFFWALAVLLIAGASYAYAGTAIQTIDGSSRTVFVTSTSGGLTITANASGVSGRRIVIDSMVGRSDKSTSIFLIQESSTGNVYTSKARLDCGAATTQYFGQYGKPIFVGLPGYYYQILLDSTTANSLIVNYHLE